MFSPIMTPSQTAVMFADGSASRIGATIGTTTTAISMKSRKKPRTKDHRHHGDKFGPESTGNAFEEMFDQFLTAKRRGRLLSASLHPTE